MAMEAATTGAAAIMPIMAIITTATMIATAGRMAGNSTKVTPVSTTKDILVVGIPVVGIPKGIPVADIPVAVTPVADTPVAVTPMADTPVADILLADTLLAAESTTSNL
jgi:hypothetical protein